MTSTGTSTTILNTTNGDTTTGPLGTAAENASTDAHVEHDWEVAGDAWGAGANDWACLFEHYSHEVLAAIFQRTDIGADTHLLDVACGSGLALRHAEGMGATTAGIDAAPALVDIARDRAPDSDLRVGSMFELPWADETFDVVTSINGVWGDCDAALVEAYRVLKPGGKIGISFWGNGKPFDLRGAFIVFALNSPSWHLDGMKKTNGIAYPGVAESMLENAGFDVSERGERISTLEWPDEETAWRALASVGPAIPALAHVGRDALRPQVLDAMEPCRTRHGGYRFRNDHHFVIATKPS